MKKLILAGIVIIICCLVFLIVRQNSSRADIGMDMCIKPYTVLFGDWVGVWLLSYYRTYEMPHVAVFPSRTLIEGKVIHKIFARYNSKTENGRLWYNEQFPLMKENIRLQCERWTLEGYPISLNDFQFDINPM